jgi:hypothetical protein
VSENEPEGRPTEFQIMVPPELEGGVYANFLSSWHTPYEFTLDFAATQPPQVPDDPLAPIAIPCRVVTRVKIPVTLVFDVIRALNEVMTGYESQFGEIRPPGAPGEGGDEP